MKKRNFNELDPVELSSELDTVRESLFRLRFQFSMGQADVLKKLRTLRKDKARILTAMNMRRKQAAAKETKRA